MKNKIEETIELLIDILKDIKKETQNRVFLNNIPEILVGIDKALNRIKLGEDVVWETIDGLTIQVQIADKCGEGSGKRLRINVDN
ncbi:MAG: hypothetical protein ABSB40_13225 [Nitrososphaeria archaeon]|jgi:hypothetical protein